MVGNKLQEKGSKKGRAIKPGKEKTIDKTSKKRDPKQTLHHKYKQHETAIKHTHVIACNWKQEKMWPRCKKKINSTPTQWHPYKQKEKTHKRNRKTRILSYGKIHQLHLAHSFNTNAFFVSCFAGENTDGCGKVEYSVEYPDNIRSIQLRKIPAKSILKEGEKGKKQTQPHSQCHILYVRYFVPNPPQIQCPIFANNPNPICLYPIKFSLPDSLALRRKEETKENNRKNNPFKCLRLVTETPSAHL